MIQNLVTNVSEIVSKMHTFSFQNMHLKMSSGKKRPFCVGLNVFLKKWMKEHVILSSPQWHYFCTEMNHKSTRFREWKKDIICTKSGCYYLFMLQYDLCHVTGVPWYPLNILRFRLTMQGFALIFLTNVHLNAGKIKHQCTGTNTTVIYAAILP